MEILIRITRNRRTVQNRQKMIKHASRDFQIFLTENDVSRSNPLKDSKKRCCFHCTFKQNKQGWKPNFQLNFHYNQDRKRVKTEIKTLDCEIASGEVHLNIIYAMEETTEITIDPPINSKMPYLISSGGERLFFIHIGSGVSPDQIGRLGGMFVVMNTLH